MTLSSDRTVSNSDGRVSNIQRKILGFRHSKPKSCYPETNEMCDNVDGIPLALRSWIRSMDSQNLRGLSTCTKS